MTALNLKYSEEKILIVGPIYDQVKKLSNYPEWFANHNLIIFNGGLCYPNNDLSQIRDRIKIMDQYLQKSKVIYQVNDQDLLLMNRLWQANEAHDIQRWLYEKNNATIINFGKSQSYIIVTGGGVLPHMRRRDLWNNLETSFVSHWQGKPWHDSYGGGTGYIISNNPLSDRAPQFHNFSLQIGTNYNPDATIYAVQADHRGIGKIFSL